ncbi:hypothetical protein PR202_ga30529 [Eleusine coracana subsp. coracana]|uniref:F-box/LRR-repeat protein 15/At3g58940/PEG3-like LRR domain-containing protein n=1 Tax=Eleusine coracana subsp. coracana TaxID=191504 RepID=A0AAV5DQR5_ELECO|nr:hypothetical protein PR202_ga30495 [Eleusine coracana subsp. coracana]GJN12265.1 hypothetical protein PR202_ga30529 [Eleusine coracana subsp. coracana]
MAQIPVFQFSATVRVATISGCCLPDAVEVLNLHFPQLKKLALENVVISEKSLNSIIASSTVLECLLLGFTIDFHYVSIAVRKFSGEFIIENSPSLERLLQLKPSQDLHLSVIAASNLKTMG